MKLGLIVEGHGEVVALPILVSRVATWLDPELIVEHVRPHRVPRGKLVKPHELSRAVEFVARKVGPGSPILVLLDADEDCPAELGLDLLRCVEAARDDRMHAVVLANREYEAWFLAASASLRAQGILPGEAAPPPDPEALSSPKAFFDKWLSQGYAETVDQAKLSAKIDLGQACGAASFRKFVRDLARLLGCTCPPAASPRSLADARS